MDAEARKGRRDPGKEKFWRAALREMEGSGLSTRAFCRERGLKENLFYSWRRELKMRDAESKRGTGFVELIRPSGGRGNAGVSLRVDDRISIVVERGFDGETLKATLAVVGEVRR